MMRNWLVILILGLCACTKTEVEAQPSQQYVNKPNVTSSFYYLKATKGFGLPVVSDTTLNGGLDTLGQVELVKSGTNQGIWYRDTITTGGHLWVRLGRRSDTTKPAGLDNYIQFNENGVFNGTNELTFNTFTHTLGTNTINASGNISGVDITASGDFNGGSGSMIKWNTRSQISATGNGTLKFTNSTSNGFTKLIFGAATSGFPTMNINGNAIEWKLGDASDWTTVRGKTQSLGDSSNAFATTAFVLQNKAALNDTSGAFNFNLPLLDDGSGNISIQDGAADGVTKGAVGFALNDGFSAASGIIHHDYTTMQVANGSVPGILSTSLYNTFNNKLSNITGLVSPGTNITISGTGVSGDPYVINSAGSGSGTLNDVLGTSNRISISGTGATRTVDISANYAGQNTITTLGAIGTGTWQGTPIADAYISSAATWNAKQSLISGALTPYLSANATANRVIVSNNNGKLSSSSVTTTSLGYLQNVSSDIQDQLNNKESSVAYPFFTVTWSANPTFNVTTNGYHQKIVLSGNTTFSLANLGNGHSALIEVSEDNTGGYSVTLPVGSLILDGDGSGRNPVFTTTANAKNLFWVTYDGVNYIWRIYKNAQ